MCGITGFVDTAHIVDGDNLKKVLASLAHPDKNHTDFVFEQKEHFKAGLASLPSLHPNSQMFNSTDGLYSICLNGSIYNYLSLRETLIKYGVIFNTLTDTEVLLAAYIKWGHKLFDKIEGAYAFAILDRKLNQLLLARDVIGSKSLFYYQSTGFYAFSSEIRTLFCYPNITKEINPNALTTYFRSGYFAGDETIYQQIFAFKKGTITVIDLNSGNSYDAPILFAKKTNETTESEKVIERVEELLTESILKREVPELVSGVWLNSCYDSSILAAILQKNQSKRIKTFTLDFENQRSNETIKANKIAEHLKTNHKSFHFSQKDAIQLLENMPDIFEVPMGDSNILSFLFMGQNIQDEVKILLTTESSDVLFGGYHSYLMALKLDAFTKHIPPYLKGLANTMMKFTSSKTQEVLKGKQLLQKYQALNTCFTQAEIEKLIINPQSHPFKEHRGDINLKTLLNDDLENYLPNNLLYKADKGLMYYGIDHRDAFLKTELIEYLSELDETWFIKGWQSKYILRKIANKHLPESYINARSEDHHIPLSSWLKTCFRPYIESYLTTEQLNKHQLLNIDEVLAIKKAFYHSGSLNLAKKVWLLLQFQMWYQRWID